jgi:DnaJ-domain-containing protein 1
MILDRQRLAIRIQSIPMDQDVRETIEQLLEDRDEQEAFIVKQEEWMKGQDEKLKKAREIYKDIRSKWKGEWPKEWKK